MTAAPGETPPGGRRALVAVALAALVLSGILLLYLLYPSAAYSGDGTLFALVVADRLYNPDWQPSRFYLHPHHLLYGPLAAAFVRALGPPVADPRAAEILRMSWLSSLLAVLALGLFFLLLRRATRRDALALGFTLLLGFSAAFWGFAVDVEIQALSLLLVVAFLLAADGGGDGFGAGARVGAAHGLAILGHILNALLVVPALARLWPRPAAGAPAAAGERRRRLAGYLVAVSLVAGIPYLLAARALGAAAPAALVGFVLPGGGYLAPPWTGLSAAARSLDDLVLAAPPAAGAPARPALARLLRPGAAVALGGLLLAALLHGRRADAGSRRLGRLAAWTLAGYLPLWLTWDVGNPEFLVFGVPAALALWAAALAASPARILVFAAAALLGGHHFLFQARPRADPAGNPSLLHAELIGAHTAEDDVVLLPGSGRTALDKFYVPYFAHRRQIVLEWELLRRGGAAATVAGLREALATHAGRGAAVHLTSDCLDPSILDGLRRAHGFGAAELEAALAGWTPRPVARLPDGFTLYRLDR